MGKSRVKHFSGRDTGLGIRCKFRTWVDPESCDLGQSLHLSDTQVLI